MRNPYTPLRLSLAWLIGTYLLFLLVGDISAVDNLGQLTLFIAAATGCFALGYWLRVVKYRSEPPREVRPLSTTGVKLLVTLSAFYYLAYGAIYMRSFGVFSWGAITSALTNPGSAYLAKFDVWDAQAAAGVTNTGAQLLTLTAVLSAPLVPFLIVYWRSITGDIRILSALALATYVALYLATGTLVGLGNVLIFAVVGFMVRAAQAEPRERRRRGATIVLVLAALVFAGYMSYNQSTRLVAAHATGRFEPNPIVESLTHDHEFARGVTVMAHYPTHGYQGLSYDLESPFDWTHFRGSSRAFDSYLEQYGFGDSEALDTYPARTQRRTGWDANITWSTIYPWLASDLTWFGTILFMGLVGWWMARFWREAVVDRRPLSVLLFGQMLLLVAFVPANNQIGILRTNLVCFVTLAGLYVLFGRPRRQSSADRSTQALESPVSP